jgi:hypothetical protein
MLAIFVLGLFQGAEMVGLVVEWCNRERQCRQSLLRFFPFLAPPFLALRLGKGRWSVFREEVEGLWNCRRRHWVNVRMLIDEAGAIVDLVVDDQVQILLSVVLSNLLEGELFGFRHDE